MRRLTIREQIRARQKELGLSDAQLLERSGLKVDRSVLRRQLVGETPMTTETAQILADAMQPMTLEWSASDASVEEETSTDATAAEVAAS